MVDVVRKVFICFIFLEFLSKWGYWWNLVFFCENLIFYSLEFVCIYFDFYGINVKCKFIDIGNVNISFVFCIV